MIAEDYVSFETAKLLKEKGFNGDTASCYILEDGTHHIMSDKVVQSEYYESQDSNEHGHLIQAPTLQMAMKWLREVHKIHIATYPTSQIELVVGKGFIRQYTCDIFNDNEFVQSLGIITGYEQACEAAIKYCLKNVI